MSSVMDAPPPPTCQHPSHPAHKLTLVHIGGGAQFSCDGCAQGGKDRRYRCELCDFDLHVQCALAPPFFRHPMLGGRTFTLCSAMGNRFCNACGDDVRGMVYHDGQADLDLHPCCAFLQDSITYLGRVFQLRQEVAASCMLCGQNGQRGKFWSYTLHANGGVDNIHVACMLHANGAAGPTRSTSSHQMTGNPLPTSGYQMTGNPLPTSGYQMTGNPLPTSGYQMTGNPLPTSGYQMTGNPLPTSGYQMTGNPLPTYGHQMTGNPTYGHQMTGNHMYGLQMTGNPIYGHQMTANNPTYGHQMTANNPTSSQMMTTASVVGVVGSINVFASLANNMVQLSHSSTHGDLNEHKEEHIEQHKEEQENYDCDDCM